MTDIAAGRRLATNYSRAERVPKDTIFESVVRGPTRIVILVLLAVWACELVGFWWWWLEPSHEVSTVRLVINSLLLGYATLFVPLFGAIYVARVKRVAGHIPVPVGRVAMVVTKAPSEPWSVVHATLEAMRSQDYPLPYDVWLCDEDPSPATESWCKLHDVRLSTRRGIPEYHRKTWPRREKCKEGNLAYFYDHWGYKEYDFVAQLDADHVPGPKYLRR